MMQFVLENFDTIFRNRESLDNLEKMMLDLAVKGKLVPQDSRDEPASELIKKIKIEKERLIAEKVIKKEKPLPPISEEEIPFEIPENWEWVRLGEISQLITKGSSPKWQGINYTENKEVLFITSENVGNYSLILENKKYVQSKFNEIQPRSILKKGDILLNIVGGSIGRTAIFNLEEVANINQAVCMIRIFENNVDLKYMLLFFNSKTCIGYMFDKQVSNARENLSMGNIAKFLIPLPPLAEQQRIVEKVERMKVLISKLKEIYSANETNRMNLKKSILAEIESSSSNRDLLDALEVIFNNFGAVIRNRGDVKDIRNLILSLAVKGKLVPQDSNDEPASELLKKIKAEKDRMIAEKIIKKEKPLPPISEEEIPFEIPESWEWVRLGENCQDIHYGYTASAEWVDTGVKLLRITDIQNNSVNWSSVPFCQIDEKKLLGSKLEEKDILIARTGGTVGKSYLIENLNETAVFASYLIRAILIEKSSAFYIKLYMESLLYWNQLIEKAQGTGQPNVNATSLKDLIMPLPPLAEQQRIVEKVNSLMKVCDLLESKIEKSENISKKLLESLLK